MITMGAHCLPARIQPGTSHGSGRREKGRHAEPRTAEEREVERARARRPSKLNAHARAPLAQAHVHTRFPPHEFPRAETVPQAKPDRARAARVHK